MIIIKFLYRKPDEDSDFIDCQTDNSFKTIRTLFLLHINYAKLKELTQLKDGYECL